MGKTIDLSDLVIFLMIFSIDYRRGIFSWCFSEHRSDVGEHRQEEPGPDLERGGSTPWLWSGLGGGDVPRALVKFYGGLPILLLSFLSHRNLGKMCFYLVGSLNC